MKRLSFVFLICLMAVGFTASSQAQPGIGTWSSPTDFAAGNWREILWGGSEGAPGNEIEATSDGVYIFDGAILDNVTEDETGGDYIKYITEYVGGTLEIVNDPSTPWYNSFDPGVLSFTVVLGTSTNQTWKYDDGSMVFEFTGTGTLNDYPGYSVVFTAGYERATPVLSGSGEPGDPQIISDELSWVKITIIGPIAVDIKPGSCPNPINTKSKGVLPVAILGTETFDVKRIDPASVELVGVKPLRSSFEDVSTPYEPFIGKQGANDCNENGPDGFTDLTLKFSTQGIISALGPVNDGDELTLELNALLEDGTPVTGEDVVIILHKGSGGQQGQDPDIIPACIRTKLKAAAKLSHSYMYYWMKEIQNQKGKYDKEACFDKAGNKFADSWGKADDKATTDCSAETMESIRDRIYYGLKGIYEQIETSVVSDDRNSAKLTRDMLKAAEMRLSGLLNAEYASNSDEGKKTAAQNKIEEKFQKSWGKCMTFQEKKQVEYNGPTMGEVMGMIDALVEDVVEGMGL
jgi:hypothetical protein